MNIFLFIQMLCWIFWKYLLKWWGSLRVCIIIGILRMKTWNWRGSPLFHYRNTDAKNFLAIDGIRKCPYSTFPPEYISVYEYSPVSCHIYSVPGMGIDFHMKILEHMFVTAGTLPEIISTWKHCVYSFEKDRNTFQNSINNR